MIMSILLVFAVFLGIIAGYFLAIIAPEEIKPGYKYLVIFQNILFSILIAVISMFCIEIFTKGIISIIVSAILALGVFALLYLKNIASALYIFTGLSIFIFINNLSYLIVACSLIFIFGMTVSGISAYDFIKNEKITSRSKFLKKIMIKHVWFIVIALLPFLFSYI